MTPRLNLLIVGELNPDAIPLGEAVPAEYGQPESLVERHPRRIRTRKSRSSNRCLSLSRTSNARVRRSTVRRRDGTTEEDES
jgi:hypothetical protein